MKRYLKGHERLIIHFSIILYISFCLWTGEAKPADWAFLTLSIACEV